MNGIRILFELILALKQNMGACNSAQRNNAHMKLYTS